MSQLYARVFVQILDSSLAEDYRTRHVFEDLLKLADDGVVDITRQALSRRLNIPLDVINDAIDKLESPDPASRDPEHEGRRIARMDEHRDWGWLILNWEKYDAVRSKEDERAKTRDRVRLHRERKQSLPLPSPSTDTDPDSERDSERDSEGALQKRYRPLPTVTSAPGEHGHTHTEAGESAVELPRGFPGTEEQAKAHAAFVGCPEDFAATVWNRAMGRGGTDSQGQPIKSWRHHLKTCWNYEEQSRRNPGGRNANSVAKPTASQIRNSTIAGAGKTDYAAVVKAKQRHATS